MYIMEMNGEDVGLDIVKGAKSDAPRPGAGRQFRMLIAEAKKESARTQLPVEFTLRSLWRGLLGLRDYRKDDGTYVTKFERDKAKVYYEDLPIRDVARELLGGDFVTGLINPKIGLENAALLRDAMQVRDGLAPVTASSQQDGNLWSVYIGGLYEAKFLEGYTSPEFIGRELVMWDTTNAREQRIPTTARVPPTNRSVNEGKEFPNVGAQPRWIVRPPVFKRGGKCSLTREAMVYGLGGTLMSSLQDSGYSLGYIQEYMLAAYIQGQAIPVGNWLFADGLTVANYIYNQEPGSTGQPAYQAAAQTGANVMYNYANLETGSSGLQTYLQLQEARGQLSLVSEYETKYRIKASLDMVKVSMFSVDNAFIVKHATSVVPVAPGFATSGTPAMTFSINPDGNSKLQVVASPIWDQQLLDAGLAQSDVNNLWLAGNFKKMFAYASVYDTELVPMDPQSASMVSTGTVWGAAFSFIGTPYNREPRYGRKYTT